jgi:hypothetical protein
MSPVPSGQLAGLHGMPSTRSISSSSSKGSLPSRSILLTKVTMGMPRMRQTWNSLMVCGSTPFTQSMSMMAVSAADSVR